MGISQWTASPKHEFMRRFLQKRSVQVVITRRAIDTVARFAGVSFEQVALQLVATAAPAGAGETDCDAEVQSQPTAAIAG